MPLPPHLSAGLLFERFRSLGAPVDQDDLGALARTGSSWRHHCQHRHHAMPYRDDGRAFCSSKMKLSSAQRGLWHVSKFSVTDPVQATEFFERAINLDRTFAAAYSNPALAYIGSAVVHALPPLDDAIAIVRTTALSAVEYDPSDADTHAAIAFTTMLTGSRGGVSEQLALALACNENSMWANGIQEFFSP